MRMFLRDVRDGELNAFVPANPDMDCSVDYCDREPVLQLSVQGVKKEKCDRYCVLHLAERFASRLK